MGWLIILIIVLMLIGSVVIVVVARGEERRREERQRRFELQETGERLPLVQASDRPSSSKPSIEETAAFIGRDSSRPSLPKDTGIDPDPPGPIIVETDGSDRTGPMGRLVSTPDGEAILTTPPFTLRHGIFSKKHGRYATALMKRIPPWLVITPRLRLDSLLTPTTPDGRDADDWRNWRRRVRLRSVDLLLCDRRSWKPLLAIIFDRSETPVVRAFEVAGGRDHIVDEVLASVGLPYVRATGRFKEDWHVIRPYIEQAMLPSVLDDEPDDDSLGGTGWDASAVVNLLRSDDEKGWMLE